MSLKRYEIGDKIIESEPFVHSLSDQKKKILCDHCFQPIWVDPSRDESVYKCGECRQMFYCRRDCQLLDQRFHRYECQIYSKYYYPYLNHHFYRLMLRSYLILSKDKELQTKRFEIYDGSHRCFNRLKSHSEEIRFDDKRIKQFEYIYETFEYFGEEFGFELSREVLFEMFCQIIINEFTCLEIKQTKERPIGSALYISASVLNHSCDPNSATIYFGSTLALKAIKKIEIGDEITINYCNIEWNRLQRQKWLRNGFYFDCNCIKCQINDFNIDYKLFDRIKRQIRKELSEGKPKWRPISRLSDIWYDICRQIYTEFHPQFIAILICILSVKLQNKCEDIHCLTELVSKVHNKVELIFGSNHVIYRQFRQCLENKNLFNL